MTRSSHSKLFYTTAVLLLVGISTALPAGVFDSISEEVNRIFEASAPSIVKVRSIAGSQPLAGSGFFIDEHGSILTSHAVVRDATKAWVEYRDQKFTAEVIGVDPRSGVALLKIITPEKTPFLNWGDSDQLRMASGLVSVAYPYNLPLAPAFGFVTGFDVRYLNRFFATTHVRASVPVSPGQIGGPLLNTKGEVMGLLVLAIQDGKECYALPSRSARRIVDDILTHGKAHHGWVGVGVIEGQSSEAGGRPVIVSNLFRETPAASSGLQPGDLVQSIGNKPVKAPSDILDAAFFSKVGEPLPIEVIRDGQKLTFQLPIVERPDGAAAVNSLIAPGKDTLIAPYISPPEQPNPSEPTPKPSTKPVSAPNSRL
ncbi:MAG: S1C family serine protease [Candidatus Methylacidiphilales bacterium]